MLKQLHHVRKECKLNGHGITHQPLMGAQATGSEQSYRNNEPRAARHTVLGSAVSRSSATPFPRHDVRVQSKPSTTAEPTLKSSTRKHLRIRLASLTQGMDQTGSLERAFHTGEYSSFYPHAPSPRYWLFNTILPDTRRKGFKTSLRHWSCCNKPCFHKPTYLQETPIYFECNKAVLLTGCIQTLQAFWTQMFNTQQLSNLSIWCWNTSGISRLTNISNDNHI